MWKMEILRYACALILICIINQSFAKIQCMDQNNKPVDWYYVYKLPKLESSDSLLSKGEAYLYVTSDTIDHGWTRPEKGIQDSESLLANTLRSYYANKTEEYWVLYNDQNPKYGKFIWFLHGGHSKGVVGADSSGGIWLVHSVPKYPPNSNQGYGYPDTGYTNGQSALCITLNSESINNVGKALGYNDADVYDLKTGPEMNTLYPDLIAAAENNYKVMSPWFLKTDLKTPGGTYFTAFAKAKKFKKDLYELVARELQTNLLVETWQNVLSPLASTCSSDINIMNIKEIGIKNENITYKSKYDHSKWAVGTTSPWICIGDINRAKHQLKRGGGTVCTRHQKLWNLYHDTVLQVEKCSTTLETLSSEVNGYP